ncbi:MAG: CDP-alcohol phosphatidyltransferase family protein [archaeon]
MKTEKQKKLENLLEPFCPRWEPNILTLVSVLLTFCSSILIFQKDFMFAAFVFLLANVFDAFDGISARKYFKPTKFGSFFDKLVDRINDFVILGTIIFATHQYLIGFLTLAFTFFASYESALLDAYLKKQIGEKISLRPIRSSILFFGILSNNLIISLQLILIISLYAFVSRFSKALKV